MAFILLSYLLPYITLPFQESMKYVKHSHGNRNFRRKKTDFVSKNVVHLIQLSSNKQNIFGRAWYQCRQTEFMFALTDWHNFQSMLHNHWFKQLNSNIQSHSCCCSVPLQPAPQSSSPPLIYTVFSIALVFVLPSTNTTYNVIYVSAVFLTETRQHFTASFKIILSNKRTRK